MTKMMSGSCIELQLLRLKNHMTRANGTSRFYHTFANRFRYDRSVRVTVDLKLQIMRIERKIDLTLRRRLIRTEQVSSIL